MDASQIREHMKVVGADGRPVGTVDCLEGDRIKLTKSGSADGQHHYIAMSDVADVRDGAVCLNENARVT